MKWFETPASVTAANTAARGQEAFRSRSSSVKASSRGWKA